MGWAAGGATGGGVVDFGSSPGKPALREGPTVNELLQTYGPHYKLVLVGDALMHPLELFEPGGAIDYFVINSRPGIEWLGRLAAHFERRVWLNPERQPVWEHLTVNSIRRLFPMFELTLHGLEQAVASLVRGREPT